ncbi:hypothetical protein [Frisingicoccus sp.]|uniref:hypothetical protein n=1 Tax=Frisingicoccus sp. TaxID=1918627 RepID=UPI003AB7082A
MEINEDRINSDKNDVIGLISSDNFSSLSDDIQKRALNSVNKNNKNEGGIVGNFLGNKKENAAINISFLICAFLLLLCAIDMIYAIYRGDGGYTELIKNVLPILSLAIGYYLGKGNKQ